MYLKPGTTYVYNYLLYCSIELLQSLNLNLIFVGVIFKPGVLAFSTWFLEITFACEVGVCVCVCVSAPEAINYIHVILNQGKFATV